MAFRRFHKLTKPTFLFILLTLATQLVKSQPLRNSYPVVPLNEPNIEPSNMFKENLRVMPYVVYTPRTGNEYSNITKNFTAETGQNLSIGIGNEMLGTELDDIHVLKDGQSLVRNKDYRLFVNQSSQVQPQGIFNYAAYNKSLHSVDNEGNIDCTYSHVGLSYEDYTYSNRSFVNMTTFGLLTFALYKNQTGIKVIKKDDLSLRVVSLDDYIRLTNAFDNSTPSIEVESDEIEFSEIHLSNQMFTLGGHLVLRAKNDSSLFIYNITERLYSNIKTNDSSIVANLDFYSRISLPNFNPRLISRVGFHGHYLIVATLDEGIYFLRKNNTIEDLDNMDWHIYKSLSLPIRDMIVNSKTIYFIVESSGLRIFDLDRMDWHTFIFGHTNLLKFDYLTISDFSYFIGISVRNMPPGMTEYFIEIIADDEFRPLTNRVYVSSQPVDFDNFETDLHRFSVLFDKTSLHYILLLRGIPNNVPITSYVIPASGKGVLSIQKGYNPIYILYDQDLYYPTFLVLTDDDYLAITKVKFEENQMNCVFKEPGEYTVLLNSAIDCSVKNDQGVMFPMFCPFQIRDNLRIEANRTSALVAILVILLIIIVVSVVVIVICNAKCCKKKKSKKTAQQMEYVKADKGKDEIQIDVQVDEKENDQV